MIKPVTYEDVVKLVDRLTVADRHKLLAHLSQSTPPEALSTDEWMAKFAAVRVRVAPGPLFSDRREDWYDDDGR